MIKIFIREMLFNNKIFVRIARGYLFRYSQNLLMKEWGYGKVPFFFKHEIDYFSMYYERQKGMEWVERGVLARIHMFVGCKVLELCSGDGTYPFLFYSDIAAQVDGVDISDEALLYANKHHKKNNIHYYRKDIIKDEFPSDNYDFIVFHASIDYFTEEQQMIILAKIKSSLSKNGKLIGSVPKAINKQPHSINHRSLFFNSDELKFLLHKHFDVVNITETVYQHRININFICSAN